MKAPFEMFAEIGLGKHADAPFEKLHLNDKQVRVTVTDTEGSNCAPRPWLTQPKELLPDSKSERLLRAFDYFLISIPVVLIAKVILVIVASKIDESNQNVDIDAVSHLTLFLIKFNSQVRFSSLARRCLGI
jgi:hypothetical protein